MAEHIARMEGAKRQACQGKSGHADQDHAGGAASLLAGMPVEDFLTSVPASHPLLQKSAGDIRHQFMVGEIVFGDPLEVTQEPLRIPVHAAD